MAAAAEEAEATDWALLPEVEVLESIYLEELRVVRGQGRCEAWELSITLHPATAQDQDSQYVRFTLVLAVPPQYPNKAPDISIKNPRGLSDEQIQKISQTLRSIAEARLGTEVLYELIEKGKEILTDNNIPYGQCVICLYGFQEREAFTKTQCYHYFHSHCLARYAQHMEEEILMQQEEREQHLALSPKQEVCVQCPVCRETLIYDLSALKAAPPPQHPLEPYRPDAKTLQYQEELRLIFKRQQEKGGIIDPEAEKNRYFISLQAVRHWEEAGHSLRDSRGPRSFSHRPEWRPSGKHSQELTKPHSRSRDTALAERKELCPESPSPVTEAVDLKEEHCDVERWAPEEGTEARAREKKLVFNRRAAASRQGHHRSWDCGRWERSRAQEHGSYPRVPRGQGTLRPSGRQEAHLEKESGS
uniref:E3 ubiquitin-protein ligase RNF25 n=1 Tax=Amazona collaria TaxID=241587 RepID=A0A8B9G9R9_9PSIT